MKMRASLELLGSLLFGLYSGLLVVMDRIAGPARLLVAVLAGVALVVSMRLFVLEVRDR